MLILVWLLTLGLNVLWHEKIRLDWQTTKRSGVELHGWLSQHMQRTWWCLCPIWMPLKDIHPRARSQPPGGLDACSVVILVSVTGHFTVCSETPVQGAHGGGMKTIHWINSKKFSSLRIIRILLVLSDYLSTAETNSEPPGWHDILRTAANTWQLITLRHFHHGGGRGLSLLK